MKQKRGGYVPSKSVDAERKRLEVNFWLILGLSLGLSVIIYGLVLPIRSSFLGILLYDRGFTQPLAIWFASIVVVLTVIKLIKLSREFKALKGLWISEHIRFDSPQSLEVLTFQKNLIRENSLVALRCGRIITAYIQSNSRKTATEFALDDSSFYTSNSESSYAFPRILIWAIPLLGFIGTVIGISQAVNGFNGFLEKSSDIGQIKEGIGTVTGGLAVAFDTTLLALLLSVLVMIPLVLVERYESRLLLAIDIFINDQLLPRLKEENEILDTVQINKAVNQAIKEYFPSPKDLIDPAHEYAQQAVANLTEVFLKQFTEVQIINEKLVTQIDRVNTITLQDRELFTSSLLNQQQTSQDLLKQVNSLVEELKISYTDSLSNQQQVNQDLLKQIDSLVEELKISYTDSLSNQQQVNQDLLKEFNSFVEQLKISYNTSLENQQQTNQNLLKQINSFVEQLKTNYTQLSSGLTHQSDEIANQLKQAANLLETRIKSLENATYKLSEIAKLQTSLEQLSHSLEKVDTVEQVILEAMSQIKGLKPSLERLSKPRIISFVESDELGE